MTFRRLMSSFVALAAASSLLALAPSAGAGGLEVAPASTCKPSPLGSTLQVQVREMTCLVNWVRKQKGLPPLAANVKLSQAGALKLADNVRCSEFSHTACGRDFTDVFRAAGYPGRSMGENLAWGSGRLGQPREIFEAWLESPGHRHNLLASQWSEMGLALRREPSFMGVGGVVLWANLFGAR
jgi:uncharacterized protein YkwD